jgi:hypothetical protein
MEVLMEKSSIPMGDFPLPWMFDYRRVSYTLAAFVSFSMSDFERPFDVLRVSTLNGSSRFERDGGTVKNLSDVLRNDGAN